MKALPPPAKRVVESAMRPLPRRVLFGRGFMDKLGFLLSSDKWTLEELERFQERRLRSVLEHAYKSVPYYHRLFTGAGLHPSDIRGARDLGKVPLLTKDIVMNQSNQLRSTDHQTYRPGWAYTSGTTGKPLHFLLDQHNREVENASVWRHMRWGGINDLDARIASFRGDLMTASGRSPRLWEWSGHVGELAFNSYALEERDIKRMVEKLNSFRPDVIRGYPHSIFIIARAIVGSTPTLRVRPVMIQTSSEQLSPHMRETIEAAFGARVLDWYGQSEYVISAGECPDGTYHQVMETGILNHVEDEWGQEAVVGTGLWNYSMPFINYEVGDSVLISGTPCDCGRGHIAFERILGRNNDIIVSVDGRALSGVGIENIYEKTILPRLAEAPEYYKMTQLTPNRYVFELYRTRELSDDEATLIRRSWIMALGEDAVLDIKELGELPDCKKWKVVESRLSDRQVEATLSR